MVNRTRGSVAVFGAGGHAKVVISTLLDAGFAPSVVLDDDPASWGRQVLGIPVRGPLNSLADHRVDGAVIGIGTNSVRMRIAEQLLDVAWVTVIHPAAVVHSTVQLGPGTVVFAGAVIQPDTTCGRHVIVNTAASIDHDCVIEDFSHIAPGARLAGNVQVSRAAFLGIGSVVIPGRHIGAGAMVGAGSVVIRDVPASATVAGSPARPLASGRD